MGGWVGVRVRVRVCVRVCVRACVRVRVRVLLTDAPPSPHLQPQAAPVSRLPTCAILRRRGRALVSTRTASRRPFIRVNLSPSPAPTADAILRMNLKAATRRHRRRRRPPASAAAVDSDAADGSLPAVGAFAPWPPPPGPGTRGHKDRRSGCAAVGLLSSAAAAASAAILADSCRDAAEGAGAPCVGRGRAGGGGVSTAVSARRRRAARRTVTGAEVGTAPGRPAAAGLLRERGPGPLENERG